MNEDLVLLQFQTAIKASGLRCSLCREFLLAFIRARKYDIQRSLKLLRNYVKMKESYPDLLGNFTESQLQPIFDLKLQSVSKSKDQCGRRIFIFRAGRWDPSTCTLDDIFRANVFYLQHLASESDTQLKGIVAIVDMKGFGLNQARHFTPNYANKLTHLIQDSFPMSFQGIHLINEPWIFDMVLSIVWPFLSTKMQKRIHNHGQCWNSLHNYVDPNCLPREYGGSQGSLEDWRNHLSNSKNVFA